MKSNFCFTNLRRIGAHPNRKIGKGRMIFFFSSVVFLLLMATYQFYQEGNLQQVVEAYNTLSVVIITYLTLVFGRKIIRKLLTQQDSFWKLDIEDDQLSFLLKYRNSVETFQKILMIFGIFTYSIKPFVLPDAPSVYNCYIPSLVPSPLFYALEVYVTANCAFCFTGYNVFICSLIVSVVVQFRFLNLKIKALGLLNVENDQEVDTYVVRLRHLIIYHQFLISFAKDLDELLSMPLSLLMTVTVSLLCINMYILSAENGSVLKNANLIVTCWAIGVGFFIVYGLPAQALIDQSQQTGDMIYKECKWYLPQLRCLRNDFLTVIRRNQKCVRIRAGNYHVVNNESILLMLKTAYSFYTFLQTKT